MKKITDERLIVRNLRHVRIAFIVQTLGILSILGYELVQGGLDHMRDNPVWLVFMITSIVYAYLTMSTSVEHEKQIKNPRKSFVMSFVIILVIALVLAYLVSITPGYSWGTGALVAAIVVICGAIPIFYVFHLRMKQLKDFEE
jgi:fatty acid desaturase